MEAERPVVREGPGRDPRGCPFSSYTPLAAGKKDGGMATSASVNGKWCVTEFAGMDRCPLPLIWHRSPRPP